MEEIIFKRKLYDKILEWKRNSDGKTALLIEGARRVGKSVLAEEFAKREYESYILIDFVEASQEVRELFEDISDLDSIMLRLQFLYHKTLVRRKSVIIFDEVQDCPKARQAIRKLVKDRRYDYIETGSLISIKKNVKNIRIPSEEERLILYPMDYEEFRWALGDDATIGLLREVFVNKQSVGDAVTRKLMRDFRLYMLIGGMPQAVKTYINTQDLSQVDAEKRGIINLYAADFRKTDPTGRATSLFYAIPEQLSNNTSRYKLSNVIKNGRFDRMEELLQEMQDSRVVLLARHSNDPNVGMSLHADSSRFKMYMNDTGLFITLAFWDKDISENVIYQKILSDKLPANLGYVYENMVAQMLVAAGNSLYYHTWEKENGGRRYEIDFLLSRRDKICPVEVKSSGHKTHTSLDAFCQKFSERVSNRYLIYTKDLRKDGATLLMPVFMTMFL